MTLYAKALLAALPQGALAAMCHNQHSTMPYAVYSVFYIFPGYYTEISVIYSSSSFYFILSDRESEIQRSELITDMKSEEEGKLLCNTEIFFIFTTNLLHWGRTVFQIIM